MSTTDSLILEIKVDAKTGLPVIKNLRQEISGVGSSAKESGGKVADLWKKLAAGAAAAVAVRQAVRLMVDMAKASIDAEETYSKFGTVFRDVATEANQQMKDLAANYGLSNRASADMLSSTGDLLTGLGMTGSAALDLSSQTQKLAVDLASFTNYSGGAEGASQALTKAMLGEREMLKSLGIAISEEMVQAELAAKGQSKLEGSALMAAKAQATLTLAMRQSPNAIGDYSRTMDSAANVTRRFAAEWENTKEDVGKAIMQGVLPVMQDMLKYLQDNKEEITRFAITVGKAIGDFIVGLKDAAVWLVENRKIITAVGGSIATAFAINGVAKWGKAVTSALNIIKAHPAMATLAAIGTAATWISEKVASDADASWTKALNDMSAIDGFKKKISAVYQASSVEMQKLIDGELEKIRDYDRRRREILGSSPLTDAIREEWNKTDRQLYANLYGTLEKCGAAGKKAGEEISKAGSGGGTAFQGATKEVGSTRKAIDSLLNGFYGIKESILEQIEAHRKNAQAIGLGADEMERLAAAASDARFRQTWEQMPVIAEKTRDAIRDMVPELQHNEDVTERLKNDMDWTKNKWEEINAQARLFQQSGESILDVFSNLGIELGGIGDAFSTAIGGVTSGLGLLSGAEDAENPLTALLGNIGGYAAIASSAIGILGSIGEALFGGDGVDDWVRDYKRLGVAISDNIVDAIKEAKEAGEDAGVAQARWTSEIIEQGEVTRENMAGYKRLINDVFMQFDEGRMSATEATNEIGESFVALAEKAEAAGLAGSKALADILNDARNRGMISDDMTAYVDSARQAGIDALSGHYAGTITNQKTYNQALWQTQAIIKSMQADGKSMVEIVEAMGPALDELLRIGEGSGYSDEGGLLSQLMGFREFYAENQDLMSHLTATQAVMDSMAKAGMLTADQFAGFGTNVKSYYDQLAAAGATEDERIQALLPMLAKQAWYAKEYGWTLDENTKKLIEQAEEKGYNLENAIPAEERSLALQERMVDALERMAGIYQQMNGEIDGMTESMDRYRYSVESAAAAAGGLGTGGSGKSGDIPAYASGTPGWVDLRKMESAWISGERGPELNLLDKRSGKIKIIPQGGGSVTGSVSGGSQVRQEFQIGSIPLSIRVETAGGDDVVDKVVKAIPLNSGKIVKVLLNELKKAGVNVKR